MSVISSRFSVTFKLLIVGFLTLILLIPLQLVRSLIPEREQYKEQAVQEVQTNWGKEQRVAILVLTVPFQQLEVESSNDSKKGEIKVLKTHFYSFLPEALEIDVKVQNEVRNRGIFKVPLYKADIQAKGVFKVNPSDLEKTNFLWDRAFFSIGLSDLQGLQSAPLLKWNGQDLSLNSADQFSFLFPSLQSKVAGLKPDLLSKGVSFSVSMQLAGSRVLEFLPLGKETNLHLVSPWSSPSFSGKSPTERTLFPDRFEARWKSLSLNRGFPQSWVDSTYGEQQFRESALGVRFIFPVDVYQQTERAVKYGILFVTLTFGLFFLFESLGGKAIHPIQYLLVGVALSVFYLLLLSLSEHFSFFLSYLAAACATVLLITFYSHFLFRKLKNTSVIFLILSSLYLYLYILLQQEDFALLLGSIGLFVILALTMVFTRRIDWYRLKKEE